MASIARIAFSRAIRPAPAARLSPTWAVRRTYTTPVNGASGSSPKNLAAEALAQKTGHAPTQPTAPKGKNKPSKIEKTPTNPAVYALYALLGITAVGLTYNVGTFFFWFFLVFFEESSEGGSLLSPSAMPESSIHKQEMHFSLDNNI
jgi:hypothetical protein